MAFKKTILFLSFFSSALLAQSPNFYPQEYWRVSGYGMAFNVEAFDINKDGKKDIVVGNWNDTYVYFGGKGVLDSTVDVVYKGRMLAICDYNGDGFKDLITMHLTNYDNIRQDYDGEILFYWGSDTTALAIDTIPDYSIPLPTKYPVGDQFSLGLSKPGVECGDFNGDGKADFVIQSRDARPDGVGVVYVYMGNKIPPDTATYQVRGNVSPTGANIEYFGDYFEVGDINHDGYDDLLLSYEITTVPPSTGGRDSLAVLDVYLGGKNFAFVENGESIRYGSRLKNDVTSYDWFNRPFSLADINADGIPDLIIDHYSKDSTAHVHFGSTSGIDTIPSFYLTDPDIDRQDIDVTGLCSNIGDFNNDGYNDFIDRASRLVFSLHLGGPHVSNKNPYGARGLLEAYEEFPFKVIACGDQNGDGVCDFIATASAFHPGNLGYVLIFLGDQSIKTDVPENISIKPESFQLHQNYPNPFNPKTVISYTLATNSYVTLKIYDVLGRAIATLVEKEMLAGTHKVEFDAERYELASGPYIYELNTQKSKTSKKMLYMK